MNFKSIIKEIFSLLVTVAVMYIVIRGFYAFVMEPFIVDGSSMEETLQDGERMFMVKVTDIERFDIVIFPSPSGELDQNGNPSLYVKRVIGVPGDTIAYQDDQLVLNEEVMEEPYLEPLRSQTEGDFTRDFDLEQASGETVVPEGHFFVLGDNRRNSLDGRHFGLIEMDDVIGEANFVYWPIDSWRMMDQYVLNSDGTEIVIED